MHITRLRGKKEAKVDDEEEEPETVWESHGEEGHWRGGTGEIRDGA